MQQARLFPIVVLVGIVVVIGGPFGTFDSLGLPERVIYWVPLVLIATVLSTVLHRLQIANRHLSQLSDIQKRLFIVFGFIVIFLPVVYVYNLLWAMNHENVLADFWTTVGMVCAATVAITLVWVVMETSSDVVDQKPAPRLLGRLNKAQDVSISRLRVNDHYVDVYMSDGAKERLLMRFADAIAEMDGVVGVSTHRSHWVAEDAMVRLTKEGTRDLLELSCGTRVPVSRRFRPDVQTALARKEEAQ